MHTTDWTGKIVPLGLTRESHGDSLTTVCVELYRKLLAESKDLDPEAARILDENYWDLLS